MAGCEVVELNRFGLPNFVIHAPWQEALFLSPYVPPTPNFLAQETIFLYSSPIADYLLVQGLYTNFDAPDCNLQFFNMTAKDNSVPFFATPGGALLGQVAQASPVLYFTHPLALEPGGKVQIKIRNITAVAIENAYVVLVGTRSIYWEVAECSSSRN
jgi:hypothetical protein